MLSNQANQSHIEIKVQVEQSSDQITETRKQELENQLKDLQSRLEPCFLIKREADEKKIKAIKVVKNGEKSHKAGTLTKAGLEDLKKQRNETNRLCAAEYGKYFAEAKKILETFAFGPFAFSETDIVFMLTHEMISDAEHRHSEHHLEILLIDRLPQNEQLLKEIAILAVSSLQFKGHGYLADHDDLYSDENYNKQENRAMKCIERIQDPKILLELLEKFLSQATDSNRISGIVAALATKIGASVFDNPENCDLVQRAVNLMLPIVSKIPMWSKTSDASLMAYVKVLEDLFNIAYPGAAQQNGYLDKDALREYFVALHKLKVDTLNAHADKQLSEKVNNLKKTSEEMMTPIFYRHYNQWQNSPTSQAELIQLVAGLLCVANNSSVHQDAEGKARIERLLSQVSDRRALFAALMERLATKECSGIDVSFLKQYIEPPKKSEALTPEQVLLNVAPLCTEAAPGNGDAHRVVLNELAKKIDLISDLYMDGRIRGISEGDEQEVIGLVRALKVMDHRYYPQAALSLADYFYRKSAHTKEIEEQFNLIENALQRILEVKSLSDFDMNLKDNIITAYGNHFFPAQKEGAVRFMQASDVFAFIGLSTDNLEGLSFEWLKSMLIIKQKQAKANAEEMPLRIVMAAASQTSVESDVSQQTLFVHESASQSNVNALLQERCNQLKACYLKEGKEDAETAKALLASFTEAEIVSIFKQEMIIVQDSSVGSGFESNRIQDRAFVDKVEKLLLNKLQDLVTTPANLEKRLKEIFLFAVGSTHFKGHGYLADHGDIYSDDNYNKQEQRALMCIEEITNPKILLDLFGKCASQATDQKRLSGIMSTLANKIIGLTFTARDNVEPFDPANLKLVHSAFNYMRPLVSKIPVWSKSSDRSLMAYLKALQMLFFTLRSVPGYFDEHPKTLLNFFVTIQQLKQDTLSRYSELECKKLCNNEEIGTVNEEERKQFKRMKNFITECEKYVEQLYIKYYKELPTSLTPQMVQAVLERLPILAKAVLQDPREPANQIALKKVLNDLQEPKAQEVLRKVLIELQMPISEEAIAEELKDRKDPSKAPTPEERAAAVAKVATNLKIRLSQEAIEEVVKDLKISLDPSVLSTGAHKAVMNHPLVDPEETQKVYNEALVVMLQKSVQEAVQKGLQKDLMELVVGILSAPHNSEDQGGMVRLSALLHNISNRNALFKLWMERLKTCDSSGVNEPFLDLCLKDMTHERVLRDVAPLCMEIRAGNGNTRRTIFTKLSAQIAKIPCATIEEYIKDISVVNEHEVLRTVQCLEFLNHKLYPRAVLSLAEYFYTRGQYQKEEVERLRLLEISLKLILKTKDSFGYVTTLKEGLVSASDLKAKAILAYGNLCFTDHQFLQAEEVFKFIGIDDANGLFSTGLTFDCLKNLVSNKQEEIAKEKKAARMTQNVVEALDEEGVIMGLDDEVPDLRNVRELFEPLALGEMKQEYAVPVVIWSTATQAAEPQPRTGCKRRQG